jgi:hypothetical protein
MTNHHKALAAYLNAHHHQQTIHPNNITTALKELNLTLEPKALAPSAPPVYTPPQPSNLTAGGSMTTYRERLKAGIHDANNQPAEPAQLNPDELPGRHAPLDELATARGIIWSSDNLTIADKQDQLRAALAATTPANTTSDDIAGLQ